MRYVVEEQRGSREKAFLALIITSMVEIWTLRILAYEEEVFYAEGGEALAQVAQRGCGCPIPGDFQGEAESGPGQPDLAVHVPVHCTETGLDDF